MALPRYPGARPQSLPRRTIETCPKCGRRVLNVRGPGGARIQLDCQVKCHHVEREEGGYCGVPADRVMVEHHHVCGPAVAAQEGA